MPGSVCSDSANAARASKKLPRQRSCTENLRRELSNRADQEQRCQEQSANFVVRSGYDYSLPTCDVYRDTSASAAQHGKYADIRRSLDAEYHGVYKRERQQWQDDVIDAVLLSGERQAHPWLIYTAGAMGAGKSHTVNWMFERGFFPLHQIVQLDPDILRMAMPEYVAHDPLLAGQKTRRETGYMLEVAQAAAMRERKHVWIDGSLRDSEWYARVFGEIHRDYPAYRIAILYVTADPEVVLQRVRKRGEATGRFIPEEEVRDSIARVPESVLRLSPIVEFLAVIDNSETPPRLTKYCDSECCYLVQDDACQWGQVQKRFSSVPQQAEPRRSSTEPARESAELERQCNGIAGWHVAGWHRWPRRLSLCGLRRSLPTIATRDDEPTDEPTPTRDATAAPSAAPSSSPSAAPIARSSRDRDSPPAISSRLTPACLPLHAAPPGPGANCATPPDASCGCGVGCCVGVLPLAAAVAMCVALLALPGLFGGGRHGRSCDVA